MRYYKRCSVLEGGTWHENAARKIAWSCTSHVGACGLMPSLALLVSILPLGPWQVIPGEEARSGVSLQHPLLWTNLKIENFIHLVIVFKVQRLP